MKKIETFIAIGIEFAKRIETVKDMLKKAEEAEKKRTNSKYVEGYNLWRINLYNFQYAYDGLGVICGELVTLSDEPDVRDVDLDNMWIFEDDWEEIAVKKISEIPDLVKAKNIENAKQEKINTLKGLIKKMNELGIVTLDEAETKLEEINN